MPTTYDIEVDKIKYRVRGATRAEIEAALTESQGNDYRAEDILLPLCVLYSDHPQFPNIDWAGMRAGVVSQIARYVRDASGLSEIGQQALMTQAGKWLTTSFGEAEARMMLVYPGLTIETIQAMDPVSWWRTAAASNQSFPLLFGDKTAPKGGPPAPPAARSWKHGESQKVPENEFTLGKM